MIDVNKSLSKNFHFVSDYQIYLKIFSSNSSRMESNYIVFNLISMLLMVVISIEAISTPPPPIPSLRPINIINIPPISKPTAPKLPKQPTISSHRGRPPFRPPIQTPQHSPSLPSSTTIQTSTPSPITTTTTTTTTTPRPFPAKPQEPAVIRPQPPQSTIERIPGSRSTNDLI